MKFHLTKKSTNRKTGPIPVSTSSHKTCPKTCPFIKRGCYGNGGPLALHWRKITEGERGVDWYDFLKSIESLPKGQLWRHNQAGDLVSLRTNKKLIDKAKLHELVLMNKGKRGFTYTHYIVDSDNAAINQHNRDSIRKANHQGFIINLSANSIEHADKLMAMKIAPVTTVLPDNFTGKSFKTPAGNKGIVCPAVVKENMTCEKCKLCATPLSKRPYIIGFPAHGSQKKWVGNE